MLWEMLACLHAEQTLASPQKVGRSGPGIADLPVMRRYNRIGVTCWVAYRDMCWLISEAWNRGLEHAKALHHAQALPFLTAAVGLVDFRGEERAHKKVHACADPAISWTLCEILQVCSSAQNIPCGGHCI